MISQVESFLCPDKQWTPKEGWRIQCPKHVSTYQNKDEDNSPKNHNQNNSRQASSQKFKQITWEKLIFGMACWEIENLQFEWL